MDAIERALRLMPKQISDWLRGGLRSGGSVGQQHRGSQQASATKMDQIAFIAMVIGFCILLIPMLTVTVTAMLVIRVAGIVGDWFRGPNRPK